MAKFDPSSSFFFLLNTNTYGCARMLSPMFFSKKKNSSIGSTCTLFLQQFDKNRKVYSTRRFSGISKEKRSLHPHKNNFKRMRDLPKKLPSSSILFSTPLFPSLSAKRCFWFSNDRQTGQSFLCTRQAWRGITVLLPFFLFDDERLPWRLQWRWENIWSLRQLFTLCSNGLRSINTLFRCYSPFSFKYTVVVQVFSLIAKSDAFHLRMMFLTTTWVTRFDKRNSRRTSVVHFPPK